MHLHLFKPDLKGAFLQVEVDPKDVDRSVFKVRVQGLTCLALLGPL